MKEFRFKIGDLVIFKAGIAECMMAAKQGNNKHPTVTVVIETIAKTCHGGTQHFYLLNAAHANITATEAELAEIGEFDVDKQMQLLDVALDRQFAAEEAMRAKRRKIREATPPTPPAAP